MDRCKGEDTSAIERKRGDILQHKADTDRAPKSSRAEVKGTGLELDKWQNEVLDTKGNIILRAGRQVGKSTVIAVKTGEFAANNRMKSIMVLSATERQAYLLFSKIVAYIFDNYLEYVKKPHSRNVTKTQIVLKNGSIIRCLPTGLEGLGIRGYTVDLLIVDEAAYIPEGVWSAIIPMLATTGGDVILLSTPKGRDNHFYNIWHDEENDYTKFHVSALDVAQTRKEPQRSDMLKHQGDKQREMSKREFMQEYLGEFVEDLLQFFPDKDVLSAMMGKKRPNILHPRNYYLGVDVARMGEDASTFEVLDRLGDNLIQVENQVTTKTLLTDTAHQIFALDDRYNFQRIYVDDEGIGIGVFDMLITNDSTKRKTIALRNSKKIIDYKEGTKTHMLKEDLYFNMLRLLEQGKITLLDDPEIFQSFKSVQYEYTSDKRGKPFLKIFGNNTHIVEGLIRAAWCVKEKNIKVWVDYI